MCPWGAHLLTVPLSGRSRRSRPPRGCTFPWGTARQRGDSAASPAELQQPLLRNRAQERPARRDLLLPGLQARGSGPVPVVLSRARLMGEGQAEPWGRAAGPGDTGGTAWGTEGGPAGVPGEQEARRPGCGEEKERGSVRCGGDTQGVGKSQLYRDRATERRFKRFYSIISLVEG